MMRTNIVVVNVSSGINKLRLLILSIIQQIPYRTAIAVPDFTISIIPFIVSDIIPRIGIG